MSTFKQLIPINIHPSIQMQLGSLLRNNSPSEIDVSLAYIFLQIYKHSNLQIHICEPDLRKHIQTFTIEGIMSLKNVKVTLFEKRGIIVILARISNNIILYEGYINGSIKETGRCQFIGSSHIAEITDGYSSQNGYTWFIVDGQGNTLLVQKLKQLPKLQIRQADSQNKLNGLIKGIMKYNPFGTGAKQLNSCFSYMVSYQQPQVIYLFSLKDFTIETKFIHLLQLKKNPSLATMWSFDVQPLLAIDTKSILQCKYHYTKAQPDSLYIYFVSSRGNSQTQIQVCHLVLDIPKGTKKHFSKTKLQYSRQYPVQLSIMDRLVYVLYGNVNGWQICSLSNNEPMKSQSQMNYSYSVFKMQEQYNLNANNRNTYRLSQPLPDIILISQSQTYLLPTKNNEHIEKYNINQSVIQENILNYGHSFHSMNKKKKMQKLINERDYYRLISQLREDQYEQNQIQQLSTSIIIALFHKVPNLDTIINQNIQHTEEFFRELFIDKNTQVIKATLQIIKSRQLIGQLTFIYNTILKDFERREAECQKYILCQYCPQIYDILIYIFQKQINQVFNQDELFSNYMRVHSIVQKVQDISEYIYQRYIHQRKYRIPSETLKFLIDISISTLCLTLFKLLMRQKCVEKEDFLSLLNKVSQIKPKFIQEYIRQLVAYDITDNKSLKVLNFVPQPYQEMIYGELVNSYPKVALAYGNRIGRREQMVQAIYSKPQILSYYQNPHCVQTILIPLLQLQKNTEDKIIHSNYILSNIIIQSKIAQPYTPVQLLIKWGKNNEKSELKVHRQVWGKYRERLRDAVGEGKIELIQETITVVGN